MLVVVNHLGVDHDFDPIVQSQLVQGRVEVSAMDEIVGRLVFDTEVGLQLRQPNHAAVFPPPELDTLGLDNMGAEKWLESPIQEEPARVRRDLNSGTDLMKPYEPWVKGWAFSL